MLPFSLDLSWEIKSLISSTYRPEAKTKKKYLLLLITGMAPIANSSIQWNIKVPARRMWIGWFCWTFLDMDIFILKVYLRNWQNLREGGVCIGLVVVKKGLMSSATPIDVFIRGLFPPTWAQRSPGWFVSVCLVENHRVWFSFAAGNLTAGQHDITRYLPKRRPE